MPSSPDPTPFIPSPLNSHANLSPVGAPVIPMSPPDSNAPMPPMMGYAPTPGQNPAYLHPYGGTPYPYGVPHGATVPTPNTPASIYQQQPPPPGYPPQQPQYAGQQPVYPPQQPMYAPQQPVYAQQQPVYAAPPAPGQPQAFHPGVQPQPAMYYPGTGYTAPVPLPGHPGQPQYFQQQPPPPPAHPQMMFAQPGFPAYAAAPMMAAPAQMMYATPGAFIPAPQPAAAPRRAGEKYDMIFKFNAGPLYGPALKPAHVQALGVHLEVNPLMLPVSENDANTRKHLVWNMLFPSSDVRLSTDPPTRSWSAGRDEPATWPRVTFLQLISSAFPWTITVHASNPEAGITCGDVLDVVSQFLQQHSPRQDYEAVPGDIRRQLKNAYSYNRSRAQGVPGGRLGDGMRRADWLRDAVMFGGVRTNDTFVFERSDGAPRPAVLELVCRERVDELDPDEEELRAREGRGRSGSRRPGYSSSRHASRSRPVTPGL